MERDELVKLLADRVLLLADRVEKNTDARGAGTREAYELRHALTEFMAESRLLVNDRINDYSVERLAEVLTRDKIDKVRALLYAREKGVEPSPLMRDPTGSVALARPDENTASFPKDPWYSRAWHAFLAQPLTFKFAMLLLLALIALLYVMSLEIKANRRELRRQQTQEGKQ